MSAEVIGIGTALPEPLVSTREFAEHAKQFSCQTAKHERVLDELYRRSGIAMRGSVLAAKKYGEKGEGIFVPPINGDDRGPSTGMRMRCFNAEAAPLALRACERALVNADLDANAVTHLVTVSCTGFGAPGFDLKLVSQLPLRRDIARTHVGFMGCHGAMNAMRVARAIVESDTDAVVLLCCLELCSLHFRYGWNLSTLLGNSLFSDGSAALVIAGRLNVSANRCFSHTRSGSFVIPDSAESIRWNIGDNGFDMELSTHVPDIIEKHLPQLLDGWLSDSHLTRRDIEGWAVHPGGARILDAVEDTMNLDARALVHSKAVLSECGNMSSPTILFVIERMLRANVEGNCIVLGFGPGLTVEIALLRF